MVFNNVYVRKGARLFVALSYKNKNFNVKNNIYFLHVLQSNFP